MTKVNFFKYLQDEFSVYFLAPTLLTAVISYILYILIINQPNLKIWCTLHLSSNYITVIAFFH